MSFQLKSYIQIEDSLLPMSVLDIGSSREASFLMALRELHSEESNQCLNIVASSAFELEVRREGEIFYLDGIQVDLEIVKNFLHSSTEKLTSFTKQLLVTTWALSTMSTSGSLIATFFIADMLKP